MEQITITTNLKTILDVPVDDYTSFDPITVTVEASLDQLIHIFETNQIRHLPVVKAKRPVGIISDRDVRAFKLLRAGRLLTANELMVPDSVCCEMGTPLEEVAMTMSEKKIGSVLVTNDEGELQGIFTSTNRLNALIELIRGDVD